MFTPTLFGEGDDNTIYVPPDDCQIVIAGDVSVISGLSYYPNFVTPAEERVLLWQADREGEWSTHWSRRTKSFGIRYAPSGDSRPITPLPEWTDFVRCRLLEQGMITRLPNQMGINEYMPGQGIAPHVDYFGGTVVSLTLGSGCAMDFTDSSRPEYTVSLWLSRCSVVVLNGAARDFWRHGIKGRLKDQVRGHVVKRNRRVSLTFRDVSE